jgi:hypothetical protein
MLSSACHESLPPPPAEPATAAYSFRRLDDSFAQDDRRGQKARRQHPSFPAVPTTKIPAYSRIVFRAGTVSVR